MTATTLLARNAALTAIAGAGFSQDYDQVAGEDTPRWEGEADAYVGESVEEVTTGGAQPRVDQLTVTTVVLPVDIARLVQIEDTLTLRADGGAEQQRIASKIRLNEMAGTGRVWLEDA